MSRIITSFVALVVLLGTTPVFAQEDTIPEESAFPVSGDSVDPTGPLSCFDYYTFGSVQADLQPEIGETTPGTTLVFEGAIINENPYPLTDGTLYAKIFKRDDDTFAAGDGNLVVDQFVIVDNLTLAPNASLDHSYEWIVPANAEGGEYYAAYFFTTSKRYNLMGLSFTDDVVGNTAPFTVITENGPIAKLSKTDTTLNDRDHHFAAFPLHFTAGETVVVSTTITNPADTVKTLPLQWNQYTWDAMNEDNLRNTKTELITLEPNETKTLTYEVAPQAESVTYITAVTQDKTAKSILDIRFVRDDIEETRINFPSVTSFPLAANTEATLFACAHSTNQPLVPDNILTLTLTDREGETIHQYQYQGDIAGAMSGFGDTFTPDRNINYALLTATLERHGVTVEEVQVTYDCQDIDPSSCLPEAETTTTFIDTIMQNPLISFLAVALLLTLLLVLFVHRRHNIGPHITAKPEIVNPLSLLFFVLLVPALFLLAPTEQVEAKSVSWSVNESGKDLEYKAPGSGDWLNGLSNPIITISYSADIYDADTGARINDGANITQGTKLRFVPKSHSGSDISWNGSGKSSDTPNGHWIPNAAGPAVTCDSGDYSGTVATGRAAAPTEIYIPLSINPPTKSLDFGGTTASLTDLGGNVYRVDSSGRIRVNFVFSSTHGHFYYRYRFTGHSCRGNNTRMREEVYRNVVVRIRGRDTIRRERVRIIDPYQLSIPARTITFNLTATPPPPPANQPTVTAVSGSNNNLTNTSHTLGIRSTDPEGDTVQMAMDWNNDGTPDTAYSAPKASGGTTNFTKSGGWASAGTYTVRAFSRDTVNRTPVSTTYTITITNPPPASVNLTAAPASLNKGDSLTLSWTTTNVSACTLYGAGLGSGYTIPAASIGNGSRTIAATVSDTYALSCGSTPAENDSAAVTVVNAPPNAPTITGPNSLNQGQAGTFSITGTDPDGGNVFYQIDWDNNGTVDATTITVPSGTSQPANRTWNTAGSYTFRARTHDGSAASAWTSKTVAVNLAAPTNPPASISGSCPTPGNSMTLSWPATPGATSYNVRVDDQTQSGWDGSCTGAGDICQDGVTGTTITLPGTPASTYNAWVHACNAAGCSGSVAVNPTFACVEQANLVPVRAASTPGAVIDPVTGNYQVVTLTFDIANMGGVDVNQPFDYRLDIDYGADGSYVNNANSGTINTLIGAYDGNGARTTVPVSNFPLGPFTLRVVADTANSIAESNEGDNTNTFNFTVAPPDPTLSLTTDRTQVRTGETATLTWNIGTVYPMNCVITGPGIIDYTFDPSAPLASTGTLPSGAITAKSEYTFRCTEPVTGAVYATTAVIESVGEVQEI